MFDRPPAAAAAVAVATLAFAVAAAGCGSSDDQQVRDTLKRYEQATARQDYDALCNKVLAPALISRLAQVGLPCDQALRIGLGTVRNPKLQVLKIRVTGVLALALVRSSAAGQPTATDTIRLTKSGDKWRISSLSGAQPPAPAGQHRSGD
jgi:hypothetical protein